MNHEQRYAPPTTHHHFFIVDEYITLPESFMVWTNSSLGIIESTIKPYSEAAILPSGPNFTDVFSEAAPEIK